MTRGGDSAGGAPCWRIYERVVACFEAQAGRMNASVTPNASIIGSISGVRRQIDVLVDVRWETNANRRVVFDAKLRKRKLTVQDVDAFVGLMTDVQAARGVLVCANGWTKAAKGRADRTIELRLMTEQESEEVDHAAMEPCPHCRPKSSKIKGVVFWDGQFPLPLGGWAIVFTGKCDVCRSFAFWCWDCGIKDVVPDGTRYECGCERLWFVTPNKDGAAFLVRTEEGDIGLDRRPAR